MLFQIIIQSIDTLVERLPLSSHVPEEPQNTDRKVGRRLRKERINLPFENLAPLPKRISTLKQDRQELVQEGLSSSEQTRTGEVEGLQVKPVLAPKLANGRQEGRERVGQYGWI